MSHIPRIVAVAIGWVCVASACSDLVPVPEAPPLIPPDNLPSVPATPEPEPEPQVPDEDDPVTIDSIEPAEGPVSGLVDVMVRGTGFRDGLEVLFCESPALDVFVISPAIAVALTPPRPAGRVDVTVLHPRADGEPGVLPSAYRYFDTIAIDYVDPAEGPVEGGIAVAVHGRGFTPDTRAFFDGRPLLSQTFIDTTLIRGILPEGRFGAVDVHAVGFNGAAELEDAFDYLAAPRLRALSPPSGVPGERVTLLGENLAEGSVVSFGGTPAEVLGVARDGRSMEVVAPRGEGLVDVAVGTGAGLSVLEGAFGYRVPGADPMILSCSHLVPARGSQAGGERIELACQGLAYGGLVVRFGQALATMVEVDEPRGRLVVTAPPGVGEASVTVRSAVAGPVTAGRYVWEAPAPVAIDSVSPSSGPMQGGTRITLTGRGFSPGMSVTIGALAGLAVEVLGPGSAQVTTPPGAPGLAAVTVRASGVIARLDDAFDYTSDRLGLSLVTPAVAGRSGGTWLRVFGEGFSPTTRVLIGGEPTEPIAFVSSAELHVRSPRLPVGVWDAEVVDGPADPEDPGSDPPLGPAEPRRDLREKIFTSYDPRSGTGGTWGPPIDGAVNVTVWGSGGYGPVDGAFVLLGSDPDGPWRGFTNDEGQVTISGPGLFGPVDVTASRDGFTAYSVYRFDARNVTVLLQQNPTPPPSSGGGGGNPPTIPPNATLRGRVTGLDKYVIAPPGSCDAVAIPETRHCSACNADLPDGGCGGEAGFSCVDLAFPGSPQSDPRCVSSCDEANPCPTGYVCAASSAGPRCLPSPGIRRAYCNVSSTSLFGYEYPIPARGWVDEANTFELDSRRLGELAIYCFGGYQSPQGVFLPTVMGVRRHVFATSAAVMENLDVALDMPLSRAFRFRLQDPPTWSTGLQPPSLVISLDLGPDGIIPFSRTLVPVDQPAGGEPVWVAPSQLASLSGPVYDANYFLYTTLAPANTGGFQPRSYNLVQFVKSIVEDRFPVRDENGWRLEGSQVAVDLFGAFLAPDTGDADGERLWAVGEKGRILLRGGVGGWAAQTSGTNQDLNAIHGTGGRDVWAVGDAGTVRRWDGIAWTAVAAPFDDYGAVFVTAERVFVAGRVRTRVLDRASGTWSILGGPQLQEVRAFVPTAEGLVMLATGGRLFLLDLAALTVEDLPSPVRRTLRAGLDTGAGLVLVGDGGVIVAGPSARELARVQSPTTSDLTALTVAAPPGNELLIVGDDGVALRGATADALWLETIPDYRSRAHAIVVTSDGAARVVGSSAFILGPFLHFPIVTAPIHDLALTDLAFAWTHGGPEGQFTRLALTPDSSITLWTLIVDGHERAALLPDLQAAAGLAPLPRGRYRLEVLRVLNRSFDIDNFTTRDFSLYLRDSWATNEAWFVLP